MSGPRTSDTPRAVGDVQDRPASTAVPTVGAALAAVALLAFLTPLYRGVDEPAVLVGGAAGLVAVGAFLARRRDLLERRVAGSLAAGSSLVVVVLSGYAITQGVLGSILLPGVEWSVSSLFLAFFLAAGSVGVGVAEYAGVSTAGLLHRLIGTLEMVAVAALGLVGISIAMVALSTPVVLVVGELSTFQATVIEYLSFGIGLGGVTVGYLSLREYDRSFIDLEIPTLWTVGWIVLGLILILGANVGISWLMTVADIEGSEHTTTQQVAENPDLLLVIVPAMILLVGPFEELLYRNVIQKALYERFSRYGAVVVASVVFTLVHVSAYATAGADQILASLSLLFVLSVILGVVYERTENLLVPALVHGCYNATVFAVLFV